MPVKTSPKLDVDTEHLKEQAADLAAKAGDAAYQAKEWTTPKVEAFIDWLLPRAEHLYKESVKAAAPKVEKAADAVSPAIDTAHDKLVDDLIPRLVTVLNDAAVRAGATAEHVADVAADKASRKSAAIAAAAVAAAEEKRNRHTGAKIFWVLTGIAVAGAAIAAWSRSRSQVDPWAEPWEPSESLGSSGHHHSAAAVVGDAADAVGEAAGAAVAKGREAVGKAADAAASAKDDLTEKVAEAKDAAAETAKKVTRRSAPKSTTTPTEGEEGPAI